ncbi:trehalose-phosphatase [Nocardioides sp. AE5]|uniref:trehalose-phosphatase n=1 Tax=Nocardioides sp. AE5 TaxID=2962573 RepID=UPI002881A16F|nr:trehalose-phosphatase [Nocardioides sp. AE5]MDT0200881.1 trehalose-phosphatase [Nocardioides sp. AE5]
MEYLSAAAGDRWHAVAAAAAGTVIGLDFDGTLAPIVDDPAQARLHPQAHGVLVELAEVFAGVAIITGRPARQVIALGELDDVADAFTERGTVLHVLGQYGNETWSSQQRRIVSPRPPRGLGAFLADLPATLRAAGAPDAYVEEKGLAVAVHTRRLPDGPEAFGRLMTPLRQLATTHGLVLEPGRSVIEARAPGTHKGDAVVRLARELDASGFLFAGDDLGDIEAFAAVAELRGAGLATLLVCSSSDEQGALLSLADIAVPGPDGVLDLLRRLSADAREAAQPS